MGRFLFIFGLVIFCCSLVSLVMSFFADDGGTTFLVSIFALLNAAIAMGVGDILGQLKERKKN